MKSADKCGYIVGHMTGEGQKNLSGVAENIQPVLLSAMNGTGKEQGGLHS